MKEAGVGVVCTTPTLYLLVVHTVLLACTQPESRQGQSELSFQDGGGLTGL